MRGRRLASAVLRLALACIFALPAQAEEEPKKPFAQQDAILAEYLARYAEREETVARVEKRFGKPFHAFGAQDYATWMAQLDFGQDADLWTWSHVTGIPVLALYKTSSFFSSNTHLLRDMEAALRMTARESYTLKTEVDPERLMPVVKDASGKVLPLRDLPGRLLLPTGRTHGFWHFEDFIEARTLLHVLAPYLLPLRALPYRTAIDGWIRGLPLSVVKIFRGKGIYFTNLPGRSFAPTMPSSNTTYKSNVGMQTGLWIEIRRDGVEGTRQNFVHEFGHILDYVILQGGYGGYRAPHQFPAFRKTFPEKERVFGIRDDKVPQTPYGYVSRYAMTNAQEGFAEHFRAYITEKDAFRKKAEEELADGHPELMEKYVYMETLIDKTPTTLVRLSPAFLELDARWSETRGHIARLHEARRLLGADAPAPIAELIEAHLASAFLPSSERALARESALRRKILQALRRLRDRERANRALAAVLGMTLELEAARGATTAKPAFSATVRGADGKAVQGTLRFDTLEPGRFGGSPSETPLELAAGGTRTVRWDPDTGEDLAPFVAVATAELVVGGQRFVLRREMPVRPTIPVWSVIGPFANPGGATADVEHPPETKVDLSASYPGAEEAHVAWQPLRRPAEARLDAEFVPDFGQLYGPGENLAAYAVVWARVPKATEAVFAFGSADGAVVWVNGERAFAWLEGRRRYRSKAHSVPIRLQQGSNEILIKVTRTARGWGFAAHLTAPDGGPLPGLAYAHVPPRSK